MAVGVVLDTDIGGDVDDALALALAALDARIDLLAVTTVNGLGEVRARIATALLELCGREDVPVGVGHEAPIDGRHNRWMPTPPADDGHRIAVAAPRDFRPAVEVIVDVLERAAEPVALACVGPVTNVARVLHDRPDLIDRVRAVHIMGGCLEPFGADLGPGRASVFDFNLGCDPIAAAMLWSVPVPIRMTPTDVTWHLAFTDEDCERIAAAGPLGAELSRQMNLWIEVQQRDRGRPARSAKIRLHDPLTIAGIADESITRSERKPIAVAGPPTELLTFVSDRGRPVEVVRGADLTALRTLLVHTITAARR